VFRATNINGPYTQINNDANTGDLTTYSDATAVPLTQYYYYVIAGNAVGNSLPSDTAGVLTGNNSPLINGLENIFVKTESIVNEPFTITDNAGDVVTVTTKDLPAFIALQSLGGSNYQLVADPGKDFIGLYTFTVTAKDDKGGSTSKTITAQVADKRTRSFFVNLGDDDNSSPAPWNDFVGFAYATKQLLNLKDEAGVTTGISIRIDSSWTNTFNTGHITGNNSGTFPDSVLKAGVLYDQNSPRRITFLGLNPAKKYNVAFIGSNDGGLTASADYSASGAVTSSLNARYNNHRVAYLNGLIPNASNNIQVTITKQASSTLMYLNGIVLEEYTDTVPLMNPIYLYAEVRDKSSVVLTWADRTNQENGYEVYRATNPAGPFNLVTTTSANVTTFTNTGLTPNTKYFFRVRARRTLPLTFSEFSNTDAVITPKSIVFVNLTFTFPASAPWNNTNVNPDAGQSFPDLKNDAGQSTGITMAITQGFNGQNDDGMQSGGSGIFPDAVMRSCYWLDRTQLGQFKLTGLNHSKRYRIGFFGSIGPGWDGNFIATYSIGNRTVYLNSFRNDSRAEYIGDVQPDENGEVLLNVSTIAAANFGFTTAIIIQSYDDAAGGTVLNAPNFDDPVTEDLITDAKAATGQPVALAAEKQMRILAYPNPFLDNVKIDFMNTEASNQVSVDVVDLTGRLMYRRTAGSLPVGMNTLRLDIGNSALTPGMYIVKLNVNGRTVSATKLVKARK
jgi:large repetitive protein